MLRCLAVLVIAMSALSPTAAMAGPPTVTPNAIPYRVTVPVALGRDGTALVVSRALIARDGTTNVDIATAPFGETPADGMTNLWIRALRPSGAVAFVRTVNDTIPTGAFTWTFNDLVLGQALEIEAHVDDRLGPRSDIVIVDDVVRRRPDVRVRDIRVPDAIPPNVPVTISAIVDEHNGDVGARANCVLSVDGATVDRIIGLWIDAGDVVSCVFTHQFASAGDHALRVSASDVDPGDWDTANNTFDRSVRVVAPFDSYNISVGERTETMYGLHQASTVYNSSPARGDDYFSERSLNEWQQGVRVYATVRHRWTMPIAAVDLTAADETGTRISVHLTDIAATSFSNAWNYDWACGSRTDGTSARYSYIYVCSLHNDYGDWSYIDLSQHAGTVVYKSIAYDRVWIQDPATYSSYTYYDNTSINTDAGAFVPFGSALLIEVAVTSGTNVDGVAVTVPISDPITSVYDTPRWCGQDVFDWATFSYCSEYHDIVTVRGGTMIVGSFP